MGWEYHNRHRSSRGRFYPLGKTAQLHIRCSEKQLDTIRGRAYARQMNITEYILDLVQRDLLRAQYGITVEGEKNV